MSNLIVYTDSLLLLAITTHGLITSNYINTFSLIEIVDAINKLVNKDSGPMAISSKFIKFNSDKITPILLNVFNSILETGYIPNERKHSYITPIPKKESKIDVSNYRGIAMQSTNLNYSIC